MTRTIAIGDIHGCATALKCLLKEIQPTTQDTIVGIGDYVDRGMESAEVIETLVNLISQCRFVPLIGNHEVMMYKGLNSGVKEDFDFWFQHGGNATLASYGGRVENIPQHHLTFLSHCIRYFETDTHFFIHANYVHDLPLSQQPDDIAFWTHIRDFAPPRHMSGKTAVVGHTPQPEGDILDLEHLQLIDTYCYGDQWLTALDVGTGNIWQANNRGDLRTSNLAIKKAELEEKKKQHPEPAPKSGLDQGPTEALDSEEKLVHLHPPVDDLEFDFKVGRVIQFLGSNQSVQVVVHLRDLETQQVGHRVLQKFIEGIGKNGVGGEPVQSGLEIACLISPST